MLVAQDLASYGKDVAGLGAGSIVPLVETVAARGRRGSGSSTCIPSDLTDGLIDVMCSGPVPVLRPLAAARVAAAAAADAPVGRRRPVPAAHRRHPGPSSPTPRSARTSSSATRARPRPTTTSCCRSSSAAQLDWCGFFSFSRGGRHLRRRSRRAGRIRARRRAPRRAAVDCKTTSPPRKRDALIGSTVEVLVDAPGVARSHREAPEIDGIVEVPQSLAGRCVLDCHDLRRDGARPRRRPSGLTMATSFGPSALATPANGVTVGTSARGAVPAS